jgi:hypothetical protein
MSRKILFLCFTLFFSTKVISQKIEFKDEVAYINEEKYIEVEKLNKMNFIIKKPYTDEKILEIHLTKAFNSKDRKRYKLPRIHFIKLDKSMSFESHIPNKKELVKFLYEQNIVLANGEPNEKIVLDYYKKLEELKNNKITMKKN